MFMEKTLKVISLIPHLFHNYTISASCIQTSCARKFNPLYLPIPNTGSSLPSHHQRNSNCIYTNEKSLFKQFRVFTQTPRASAGARNIYPSHLPSRIDAFGSIVKYFNPITLCAMRCIMVLYYR